MSDEPPEINCMTLDRTGWLNGVPHALRMADSRIMLSDFLMHSSEQQIEKNCRHCKTNSSVADTSTDCNNTEQKEENAFCKPGLITKFSLI
jgi:hypothetical protein